jgi:hypothetical protein
MPATPSRRISVTGVITTTPATAPVTLEAPPNTNIAIEIKFRSM